MVSSVLANPVRPAASLWTPYKCSSAPSLIEPNPFDQQLSDMFPEITAFHKAQDFPLFFGTSGKPGHPLRFR